MFGEQRKWTREQRDLMLGTLPITAPAVLGEFPPGTFETAAGSRTFTKHWGVMVRRLFEQDKHLNQTGFVFCAKDHTGAPAHRVLHMEIKGELTDCSKDCLADAMKLIASTYHGVATIMVSEAWMCLAKAEDYPAVEAYRREHGSLHGHPDRREIAMMLVETRLECLVHMAAIERHADGSRTLGEWQIHEGYQQEGRFVGLLHSESSDA